MNVLFVCTMNAARSIAAERMYRHTPGISVRSAGVATRARHLLTASDVEWAERIIVFEDMHRQHILDHFGLALDAKITDIGLPDEFSATNKAMLSELRELLTDLLGAPCRQ